MRKWGIVGALLFVAACVVGFIFNFDGSDIVAIGLAAFFNDVKFFRMDFSFVNYRRYRLYFSCAIHKPRFYKCLPGTKNNCIKISNSSARRF